MTRRTSALRTHLIRAYIPSHSYLQKTISEPLPPPHPHVVLVEPDDMDASYIPYHQVLGKRARAPPHTQTHTQTVQIEPGQQTLSQTVGNGSGSGSGQGYGYGYGYESVYEPPCMTLGQRNYESATSVFTGTDIGRHSNESDAELQPEGRLWRYLDNIASSTKSLGDLFADNGPYLYC
jgi:hypothetical protein